MPIRPENRDRYPDDWTEISRSIKERAGWRCECQGECGWAPCTRLRTAAVDYRCLARHGQPHPMTGSIVVLTTAHLDHTPENCDGTNLMAMCQGCHLSYDRDHHAETARQIREAERAAGEDPLPIEERTTP